MANKKDIGLWVFGYGSIIWRPAMPYITSHLADVDGWARRFWQGSHDHRGTIHSPGRVLTLVPMPGYQLTGKVFAIDNSDVEQTLIELDYREKNGYQRHWLNVRTEVQGSINALTYIAVEDNAAWLGDASNEAIAMQIRHSHGPSGSNTDYVLSLNRALIDEGIHDEHIQAIARLLE